MEFQDVSKGSSQSQPQSGAPLLHGKVPKSREQGCCARNKKKILIIGSVTTILLIGTVVSAFFLLPVILNGPSTSSKPARPAKAVAPPPCEHHNHTSTTTNQPSEASAEVNSEDDGTKIVSDDDSSSASRASGEKSENPLSAFVGDWRLYTQENLDDFLKAIGVGYFNRMMAPSIKSEVDIKMNGPNEIIMEARGFSTTTKIVPLNVEFEDKTADGRTVMTTHSAEGDKWIQMERWDAGDMEKTAKYVREIVNDELIVTIYIDDVICTRTYERI